MYYSFLIFKYYFNFKNINKCMFIIQRLNYWPRKNGSQAYQWLIAGLRDHITPFV